MSVSGANFRLAGTDAKACGGEADDRDIRTGYARLFLLPIVPPSHDLRLRWIEAHCTSPPQSSGRGPVQLGYFTCG